MKHTLLAAGLACVGALLTPSPAETCSCAPLKPPAEAASEAGLVFSGKVVEIARIDPNKEFGPRRIRLKVLETFHGKAEAEIALHSNGGGSAACDYDFQLEREYLVYAYRHTPNDMWTTSTCSRTRRMDMAADDLRYFRAKGKH